MQSEKPRVAKKAQENKLFAKPVERAGTYQAVKKRDDQSVSARVGNEPEDGAGSGAYSEFLHQWVENVKQLYPTPVVDERFEELCGLVFEVGYSNGHVTGVESHDNCGSPSDPAFAAAIKAAPRPPMPTSFANQPITFVFYGPGITRH